MDRLSFDDLIEIAAIALEVPPELLEKTVCVFRAQAVLAAPFIRLFGADVYDDPVERAVICALLMIRWQPFLAGNTDVAAWCLREMLVRSHYIWLRPDEAADEILKMLERVEAGTISDAVVLRSVRRRVRLGTGLGEGPTA
ncbi:MAG TPA: hypothetical protein VKA35_01225 [Solirubrobacterales bacterium]|nr:hypothetical protein [Solirubrobacterales bacterium]